MSVISGCELLAYNPPILTPFVQRTKHHSGLTFGAGPAGYDVRIAETHFLESGQFALGSIMEKIMMPKDMIAIVHDKSTWARRGICVQNTVIEPGWRGFLTIELSNHGSTFVGIEAGMPIAQLIFHRVEGYVMPYDGRYQDQAAGPQPAIMRTE